jgi:ATP-binding cassette subfamily B (MDR/TAP) protein 1
MEGFENIQFDNITFAYENRPNKTILKNFSLKIEAGQHVALIGEIYFLFI